MKKEVIFICTLLILISSLSIISSINLGDIDKDGVPDSADNCKYTPNGPDRGTCVKIGAEALEILESKEYCTTNLSVKDGLCSEGENGEDGYICYGGDGESLGNGISYQRKKEGREKGYVCDIEHLALTNFDDESFTIMNEDGYFDYINEAPIILQENKDLNDLFFLPLGSPLVALNKFVRYESGYGRSEPEVVCAKLISKEISSEDPIEVILRPLDEEQEIDTTKISLEFMIDQGTQEPKAELFDTKIECEIFCQGLRSIDGSKHFSVLSEPKISVGSWVKVEQVAEEPDLEPICVEAYLMNVPEDYTCPDDTLTVLYEPLQSSQQIDTSEIALELMTDPETQETTSEIKTSATKAECEGTCIVEEKCEILKILKKLNVKVDGEDLVLQLKKTSRKELSLPIYNSIKSSLEVGVTFFDLTVLDTTFGYKTPEEAFDKGASLGINKGSGSNKKSYLIKCLDGYPSMGEDAKENKVPLAADSSEENDEKISFKILDNLCIEDCKDSEDKKLNYKHKGGMGLVDNDQSKTTYNSVETDNSDIKGKFSYNRDSHVDKNYAIDIGLCDYDVSFGWSSGGGNAFSDTIKVYNKMKEVYEKDIIKERFVQGMILFDATGSNEKSIDGTSLDRLPPTVSCFLNVLSHGDSNSGLFQLTNHEKEIGINMLDYKINLQGNGFPWAIFPPWIDGRHWGSGDSRFKEVVKIYIDALKEDGVDADCSEIEEDIITYLESLSQDSSQATREPTEAELNEALALAKQGRVEYTDENGDLVKRDLDSDEQQFITENILNIQKAGGKKLGKEDREIEIVYELQGAKQELTQIT